jgi:hypothetical protein
MIAERRNKDPTRQVTLLARHDLWIKNPPIRRIFKAFEAALNETLMLDEGVDIRIGRRWRTSL